MGNNMENVDVKHQVELLSHIIAILTPEERNKFNRKLAIRREIHKARVIDNQGKYDVLCEEPDTREPDSLTEDYIESASILACAIPVGLALGSSEVRDISEILISLGVGGLLPGSILAYINKLCYKNKVITNKFQEYRKRRILNKITKNQELLAIDDALISQLKDEDFCK